MRKALLFFKMSICCFLLNSLVIAFIPFVNYGGSLKQNIISYAISVCLWGFTITGFVCLYRTQYYRRLSQRRNGFGRLRRYKLRPGILNVLTSKKAAVFDVLSLLLLVAFIVVSILLSDYKFALSIAAALFAFTFQMRCILNGKIYIDLKTLKARRYENE